MLSMGPCLRTWYILLCPSPFQYEVYGWVNSFTMLASRRSQKQTKTQAGNTLLSLHLPTRVHQIGVS